MPPDFEASPLRRGRPHTAGREHNRHENLLGQKFYARGGRMSICNASKSSAVRGDHDFAVEDGEAIATAMSQPILK
jgi:hypothetical protein